MNEKPSIAGAPPEDCRDGSWNEADRLAALERYAILDTGREPAFDDIATLAADILEAPIAVVNFIAADRQWFKAEVGIGADALPLDMSICRHAILQPGVTVVPDLSQDPRFEHNPLVNAADGGLRFYAGALLETPEGLPLGTVCVLDTRPRPNGIGERQRRALRVLAQQTMAQLELKRAERHAAAEAERAEWESRRVSAIFGQAPAGLSEIGLDGRFLRVNDELCRLLGRTREEMLALSVEDVTHPDDREASRALLAAAVATGKRFTAEKRYLRPGAAGVWASSSLARVDGVEGEPARLLAVTLDIGEQKAAQAALRESEARYRTLFEAIEAGFCVVEVLFDEAERPIDYRFVEMNPAFENQTGLSDAAGRTARELVPDLEPHWFEIYGRVALTGVPVRFENGSDAMGRWFDVHALRVGAPEARRVAILFNDISGRKRSEQALRAQAEELRTVLDAVPAGIWITREPDAQEIMGNARSYEMLRVPAGRNQSKSNPEAATGHFEFLDPQGRTLPPEELPVQQAAQGREVRDYEFRVAFADGARLDIFGNAMPFRDGAGRISGAVAAFVDITARKAAEDRLRELNETLERRVAEALAERKLMADIIETTDAFVHVLDLDYRWLAINRAGADEFERVFGLRPAVGDRLLDLLADQPEQRARAEAVWSRALAGEEFTAVAEFGEPGRKRGAYEMKFNTLRDEGGERIGAFQVVTDVSERIRDQARLAEAEEQLRQSQKMEAVGQLTGGIAHDFNNMLAVVIGGLSMIERKLRRGDTDVARYVEGAMEGANRAASLTQRLLAFARQQPLAPEPVDLNGMIEGMTDLLARSLGETTAVETRLMPGLWLIKVDRSQLENAVLNLALNARDAMPEGGRLTLATANLSPAEAAAHALAPGRYVAIAVSDTGTGMSEKVKARAFDPFFTTKGVGKGTGLGLSQVFGFIRQSGGHVAIETKLGRGTTVRLFLPRFEGAHASAAAKAEGAGFSDGRSHEIVMVVEDEERVRSLSVDALRELGYGIVEAPSATDALQMIESGQPVSLLFTDVVMPDMNGAALAAEARRLRPEIKVLFATGYAREEGGDGSLATVTRALGADVLLKPFDVGQLARKVRAALDGGGEERD